MKKEKTKPIPKYIVARIKKADTQNNVCLPGRTRFYSYLTKNDGELVKVTYPYASRKKPSVYRKTRRKNYRRRLKFIAFYGIMCVWLR